MALKKQKITRKQLLKEPDEFITFSARMLELFREYEKQVYIGLIVFLSLIILISGFRWYRAKQNSNAFQKYDKAQSLIIKMQETGQGEGYAEINEELGGVIDKFSGTRAAKMATLTLAHVNYQEGEYIKAIKNYEKALKMFKNDALSTSMIRSGLAYSHEGNKNYEKALNFYQEIINDPDGLYKEDAYYSLGRVYAQMGNKEKSKEAYKEFADKYPDSAYSSLALSKI